MIKTKKNFFIIVLTLVMLCCGLLLSTSTTMSVKAATLDTTNYVLGRAVDYGDNLANKPFRIYENSLIEFSSSDGPRIKIGIEARGYFADSETNEYEDIDVPYVEGFDTIAGAYYVDYLLSEDMLKEYLGDSYQLSYLEEVYLLSENKDYFADKNLVVGSAVNLGDDLVGRYVRFYLNQETQGMVTMVHTVPDESSELWQTKISDGYIDYFFPEDRFYPADLVVDTFIDSIGEWTSENDAFFFLEEAELEEPTDEPIVEPEEPSQEPTETPNNEQQMDRQQIIKFASSALILVVTFALIISLFKRKNRR